MKDEYEAIVYLKPEKADKTPIEICVNRFASITKFCKWYEELNDDYCDVDLFALKPFKKLDVKTIIKVWEGF